MADLPELILAVDPSLTGTGWCRVQGERVRDSGVIATKPEMIRPERIEVIRAALIGLVDECTPWKDASSGEPVLIAMEAEIFLGSAVTNADQTALQAVLQSAFYFELKGAEFLSINVAHVKKYINAKQKDEILLRVFQRYKVEFTNHNQADAFVLAQIASDFVHYRETGKTWPELIKPQHEVLDKLLQQPKSWEILKRRAKKGKKTE